MKKYAKTSESVPFHQDAALEDILACRAYLYQLFATLFGSKPSSELLHAATSEETIMALAFYVQTDTSALAEIRTKMKSDPESTLESLIDDYTCLFVGPNMLCAPPWESAYVSCDRTLFTETTLNVRSWYLKHGFLPETYPHESDDHLAFELDFMHRLSQQALDLYFNGSDKDYRTLLENQDQFLLEHLMNWVDRYSQDLATSKADLYPALGTLLSHFLHQDKELVIQLLQ